MHPRLRQVAAGTLFCAVCLAAAHGADEAAPAPELLPRALKLLGDRTEIVLAVRYRSYDHWYANFGYWVHDPAFMLYGRDGGKLCVLDLGTKKLRTVLEDPEGSMRDPHVHYDGRTILFSYRKGGTRNYNLYEIQADGTGLRQITHGPFDDIEPIYLPNDEIVFISSRCKRFVPCWFTQVGIMYRCDRQGRSMRDLSSNVEHENTPWMLPDGRVLYMRWEYVSRHVNYFHHLWTINPDGTAAMTYFGNMHPHNVMIDAKPIPGTNQVIAIFSPGHGREEHRGAVVIVDPDSGPDKQAAARVIAKGEHYRDPYALAKDLFLVARRGQMLLMDDRGREGAVFSLPDPRPVDDPVSVDPNSEGKRRNYHRSGCPLSGKARVRTTRAEAEKQKYGPCRVCSDGLYVNEPRPLRPRRREPVLADRCDPQTATGKLILTDIYHGRNLPGIKRGEIKSLLVLEELPQPYSHNDKQGLTRALTVRSVLGTVPIEPDGSAYFEVPAMRSLYFVALDANGTAVKFMQSFVSLVPGETSGCVGCHEYRNETIRDLSSVELAALRRPPSRPLRAKHVPAIYHHPRDVQPILDRHCVKCHGLDAPPAGGVVLTGDRGVAGEPKGCVFTQSYVSLFAAGQIAYNVEGLGSRPPRTLGSGASALMGKIDGTHHKVKLSPAERETVRTWIDASAHYCGTVAWNANGFEPFSRELFPPVRRRDGEVAPTPVHDVAQRRCLACHPLWARNDRRMSPSAMFNLTRPELSRVLLAPLATAAGGWDVCGCAGREAAKLGRGTKDHLAADAELPEPQRSCRKRLRSLASHLPRLDEATRQRLLAGGGVFADATDPDYQAMLAAIRMVKGRLDRVTTPEMPGYRPDPVYVREMKRYGILPETLDLRRDPINVFEVDAAYWRSFWPEPKPRSRSAPQHATSTHEVKQ